MRTRKLGRTHIEVPEIGFGCGPTAGLMVYGTRAEQGRAALDAFNLGITYFDTAPIYGDEASEENLGRALRDAGIRPQLATKVALELDDLEDIPSSIRKSVDSSLRRLQVDDVTVIQLHNRVGLLRAARSDLGVGAMLTVQDVLGPVAETFRQLQAEGKTQAIGCCAYGGDLVCVDAVLDSGAFDTVLVGYNILNPTAGRTPPVGFSGRDFGNVMERAAAHGTAAIVLRVLESGALSGAGQPHPTSAVARRGEATFASNAQRAHSLRFLVRPGQTMVQAAIRFALQDPRVGVVLVGFSSSEQLEEAAAAASGAVLDERDMQRIEELYRSDFGLGDF